MKELKTIHRVLSNNQILSFYIKRHNKTKYLNNLRVKPYYFGLRIGKSKRENNDWYNDRKDIADTITGKCGTEGLLVALHILLIIEKKLQTKNKTNLLVIDASNEKRLKTYKYLYCYGYEAVFNNNLEMLTKLV